MKMAYDAQSWQNFYIMVGGAAAALTGLLFVAMSIHAKAIIAHPLLSNRAVGTLISLLTQLALAGAVLAPGQSPLALGVEVEIAAVFFLVFTGRSVVRPREHVRATRSRLRMTLEKTGGSIRILLFLASGLRLLVKVGGGFYLLAIVMLFMFGWNVYISWSLIADVAE
jgi:modulator of FtsH protease